MLEVSGCVVVVVVGLLGDAPVFGWSRMGIAKARARRRSGRRACVEFQEPSTDGCAGWAPATCETKGWARRTRVSFGLLVGRQPLSHTDTCVCRWVWWCADLEQGGLARRCALCAAARGDTHPSGAERSAAPLSCGSCTLHLWGRAHALASSACPASRPRRARIWTSRADVERSVPPPRHLLPFDLIRARLAYAKGHSLGGFRRPVHT